MEKLKRDKTMRRARGKTAKHGKNAENYSMSARIARISRINSIAFERGTFASHSCPNRARALRRARRLWDTYNVTEDADLGYRLARAGWRAGMISPPTWEEAPISFAAWRKQRTRWIKGHLQTWLVLMRNPFAAIAEMGLGGFLSMQIMLGGGVAAALLHGPMALLMLAALFSPANVLGPAGFALALCGYCGGAFSALTATALSGDLSHARAAPTMPLYWPLSTIAALFAVLELIVAPHRWAKTAHGVSPRAHFPFSAQPLAQAKAEVRHIA